MHPGGDVGVGVLDLVPLVKDAVHPSLSLEPVVLDRECFVSCNDYVVIFTPKGSFKLIPHGCRSVETSYAEGGEPAGSFLREYFSTVRLRVGRKQEHTASHDDSTDRGHITR